MHSCWLLLWWCVVVWMVVVWELVCGAVRLDLHKPVGSCILCGVVGSKGMCRSLCGQSRSLLHLSSGLWCNGRSTECILVPHSGCCGRTSVWPQGRPHLSKWQVVGQVWEQLEQLVARGYLQMEHLRCGDKGSLVGLQLVMRLVGCQRIGQD